MESIKNNLMLNFKHHPVLSFISSLMTVYIAALLAIALVYVYSPQSPLINFIESLFG